MIPLIPILWLVLALVFLASVWKPMRELSALVDHPSYPRPGGSRHSKPRLAARCTVCNPPPKET